MKKSRLRAYMVPLFILLVAAFSVATQADKSWRVSPATALTADDLAPGIPINAKGRLNVFTSSNADRAGAALAPIFYFNCQGRVIGISMEGNLIYFEMPNGYESHYTGTPHEGYAFCVGGTAVWDIFSTVSDSLPPAGADIQYWPVASVPPGKFLSPTGNALSNYPWNNVYPGTAVTTGKALSVTVKTKIPGYLNITQVFTWSNSNPSTNGTVRIAMTLKAVTNLPSLGVKRICDFDVDTGGSKGWAAFNNYWGKDTQGVWAFDYPVAGKYAHMEEMFGYLWFTGHMDPHWDDWRTCPTDYTDEPVTPPAAGDPWPRGDWGASVQTNGSLLVGQSLTLTMYYRMDNTSPTP